MSKITFTCVMPLWFLLLWSMHSVDSKVKSQQVVIDHLLDAVIILQKNQIVENKYILDWVQEQSAAYDNPTGQQAVLEVP